jgi:hypothetical protein
MSIISHTSSNLIDPNEVPLLTAADIREREYGSKWVLVVEQMQMITIWIIKFCLLIMYNRLTSVKLPGCKARIVDEGFVLTIAQDEFEAKSCCQDRGRICYRRLYFDGDSLSGSMVPTLQPVLGCAA